MYTQPIVSVVKLGAKGSNFKGILGVLAGNTQRIEQKRLSQTDLETSPGSPNRPPYIDVAGL